MGLMRRILAAVLLLGLMASLMPAQQVVAQMAAPPPEVYKQLEELTPEERVGQLFLVTFTGKEVNPESEIYDLIVNHHVGGVVLLSSNDNFSATPDTIQDTHQLISNLQRIEWESTLAVQPDPQTGTSAHRAYVPLFVGIEQDGGGSPFDQILSGLTPIPNAMALGATWKPELAQQIGEIQGAELAALGFNFFLGPSLDVLDSPNPSARSNIGTRSFGGDPYWVGEMGRAFISGLHTGSNGRMLVITKHFPGLGSSDRPVDKEVSTIRKSLEQLKQIELAPFFAVTGRAPDTLSTADGVLVSHIRFQGFQGNIRATTRPVSFDQQALGEILALPELSDWYHQGGLVVSDNLGSRAVYTFYAPANEGFSPQLVARDAFLAGNDLLYLGNITSGSETDDTYNTTINVLNFFTQRYHEDPAFAQLVDEAVVRILTRKYQLYNRFGLADVLTPDSALAEIGQPQQPIFEVARRAATLISPDPQELSSLFPSPPALRDRLVFITDTSQYTQCNDCPLRSALTATTLQDAVTRLYGPNAGGQVSEARLSSYSFDDLQALLNGADVALMQNEISRANWIVLALSGASHGQPELISRFLSDRQDLLRDKRVILFSFTVPYYLDATDISKLTAYYGLYSKQPVFVDVAARLLYQELTPLGFSPVSIPATGYDLIDVTRPDPNQVISLFLDFPPATVEGTSVVLTEPPITPEPTPIPLLHIGDTVYVRTGVIYDHNDHTVPDGTVVRFSLLLSGEGGGIIQQMDQTTIGGVAQVSFALEKPGLLEVRASSEPASLSEIVQIDVSSGEVAIITVVAPVLSVTTEPTAILPTPVDEDEFVTLEGFPRLNSWALAMIQIALGAFLAYWIGSRLYTTDRWGWRWSLLVALGGLASYDYMALGLPGSTQLTLNNSIFGVMWITFLGELVGLALAWIWAHWEL